MSDTMGTFRIEVGVSNVAAPGRCATFQDVLVDTGAELSWIPAQLLEVLGIAREKEAQFRQTDGTVVTRWTGFAIVHVGATQTADEVVFGESGDLTVLGARTLTGLNLSVDPVGKRLVDAGPIPAAAAA